MADLTVKVPQGFPAGTTLSVYVDRVGDITPQGAPVSTAVIGADSSVTLTGLTPQVPYQVGAVIGGKWRSFLIELPTGVASSLPELIADFEAHEVDATNVHGVVDTTDLVLKSRQGVFNVKDYGAKGDGTTDDTAAIQAAITACAGNGIVYVPRSSSSYLISTGPMLLERSYTGFKFQGGGVGQTTFKLSGTASLFGFNKLADHDTFQNIELCDFTVDANSTTGAKPIIIGTRGTSGLGTNWTRINLDRISLRRIKTINVTTDATLTNHQRNVMLSVAQAAASEGTQNYMTNILCEDLDLNGGNIGIAVYGTTTGSSGSGYNIYYDNIRFVRCRHTLGTIPAQTGSLLNFQVGSLAAGGSVTIKDCYGYGSGDVGIEVDNHTDLTIEDCLIEEYTGNGYYLTNFNWPVKSGAAPASGTSRISEQRAELRGCKARRYTATAASGSGFRTAQNNSLAMGKTILRDCSYYRSEPTTLAITGEGAYFQCPSVEDRIDGFTSVVESLSLPDPYTGTGFAHVFVQTGTHNAVRFKGLYLKTNGVVANTLASDPLMRMIELGGGTFVTDFTLEDIALDMSLTKADLSAFGKSMYGILIGNSSMTSRGRIRGVKVVTWTGGGSGWRAISIGGQTISAPVPIENCDFSVMATGVEIDFLSSPTNRDKIAAQNNNLYQSTAIASAATVTLLPSGNYFTITGTTTITSVTASYPGRVVTLNFGGILTFTDGSNLKLNANFVTTADDTITLVCDGTNWIEIARSVN